MLLQKRRLSRAVVGVAVLMAGWGAVGLTGGAAAQAAGLAVGPVTQTCPVPIVGDPDSVSATVGPTTSGMATVIFTAAETPQELMMGSRAPHVRLFLTIPGGNLLQELTGPSSVGNARLNGPSMGVGQTSETLTVPATIPATYRVNFLVLFDGGLHPCLSGDGMHVAFTVTESGGGTALMT
jgi:hypothetical protein